MRSIKFFVVSVGFGLFLVLLNAPIGIIGVRAAIAQEAPEKDDDDEDEDSDAKPEAKTEGNDEATGDAATPAPGAPATGAADDAEAATDADTAAGGDEKPASDGSLLQYILGLEYNPLLLTAKKGEGTEKVEVGVTDEPGESKETKETDKNGKITTCTRTDHSLTGNSESVAIVQPTQGVIYPGALILVDDQMNDGKPRAIPRLKRGPVHLLVRLPGIGQAGGLTIDDPDERKVQAAIENALEGWLEKSQASPSAYKNAARGNYSITEAFSASQLAISMSAKVGYMAISASAGFSMSDEKEKRSIVAVYKQVFYTITFAPPNGFTPDQFFDPSVTVEQAKSAFSNETPLGYVASVDYGRLLMFNVETDKSVSSVEAKAALDASLGPVTIGAAAAARNAKILENSKITFVALGGNAATSARQIKSADELKTMIEGENALFTRNNPGVPIGYTVKFAKDDRVAMLGKTTDYTDVQCNSVENRSIKVENRGAFAVREFVLSYDTGAKDCKANPNICNRNSGDYKPDVVLRSGSGNLVRWDIPGDATNVKLLANVVAGTDRVKWLDDPKLDYNVCYFTTGTTLSSSNFEKSMKGVNGCD